MELYTTSKNLSEFLAVTTRFQDNSISINEALIVVKDFQSILSILYPSLKSFHIFNHLLGKYKPTGLKIHDFEILSIGLANDVSTIATFNVKDIKDVEEITFHPFETLKNKK